MKKGISLIVLVITIIVIIILAGAVIMSLSQNNPILQATEAKFKASMAEYNSQLSLYISNQYASSVGSFDSNSLNASTLTEVQAILTGITNEDAKTIRIVQGKLSYIGSIQNEIDWSKEINVSLNSPYVKNGLVLWYDGVNNGGIDIHNDNTSPNKNIWKDLSGNDNDMTIVSTDFNISDGWANNCLVLDGTIHGLTSNNPLKNQTLADQNYTIEIVFEKRVNNAYGCFISGINNSFYITYNTKIKGLHYINGSENDLYAYSQNGTPLDIVMSYTGTYLKNNTDNTVTMWSNARDKMSTIGILTKIPVGMTTSLIYTSFKDISIYSIRIYDRVLSDTEITQNYELDKTRYLLS